MKSIPHAMGDVPGPRSSLGRSSERVVAANPPCTKNAYRFDPERAQSSIAGEQSRNKLLR
jgi:hypothetical protein